MNDATIVRNGLYTSPGGGPSRHREEALAALDRIVADNERLRAALDMILPVAERYLDTGRGDLDGAIDFARQHLALVEGGA